MFASQWPKAAPAAAGAPSLNLRAVFPCVEPAHGVEALSRQCDATDLPHPDELRCAQKLCDFIRVAAAMQPVQLADFRIGAHGAAPPWYFCAHRAVRGCRLLCAAWSPETMDQHQADVHIALGVLQHIREHAPCLGALKAALPALWDEMQQVQRRLTALARWVRLYADMHHEQRWAALQPAEARSALRLLQQTYSMNAPYWTRYGAVLEATLARVQGQYKAAVAHFGRAAELHWTPPRFVQEFLDRYGKYPTLFSDLPAGMYAVDELAEPPLDQPGTPVPVVFFASSASAHPPLSS